jgi:hypothetical protein
MAVYGTSQSPWFLSQFSQRFAHISTFINLYLYPYPSITIPRHKYIENLKSISRYRYIITSISLGKHNIPFILSFFFFPASFHVMKVPGDG